MGAEKLNPCLLSTAYKAYKQSFQSSPLLLIIIQNKTKWIWIYDREKIQYSAIKDHKMQFKAIK